MPTSMKQATVLMETLVVEDRMANIHSVTQTTVRETTTLHPGSPLITAQESLLKGLSYSTEQTAVENELEMSMSAFRTSFQLLAAKCFLAAPSLAILLDLALMGNTSSSQVKLNYKIIIVD